jgi:hypothetical protein
MDELTRREWRELVARDAGMGLGAASERVAKEVAAKPHLDWDLERLTAEQWDAREVAELGDYSGAASWPRR